MSLDASTSVRAEEADEAASDSITEPRNHRTQNNTSQALSVRFDNVCRAFPGKNSNEPHVVLKDITLDVVPGEVLAILGPSGSGKSTLLRAASGLDAPTRGTVLIDGTPVNGIDDRCAVAFQEPRLLPWQNIHKNVELGLPQGTPKAEAQERVRRLLELVELDDYAHLRPREVSGGMAQRTSLARALARRPGVLLLDEPFGALDALTRLKMQDLLLQVHEAHPTTVLLVTHDVDEALQLADRIVVLGRKPRETAASVAHVFTAPGDRPRNRSDEQLGRMRLTLLSGLGVDTHRH